MCCVLCVACGETQAWQPLETIVPPSPGTPPHVTGISAPSFTDATDAGRPGGEARGRPTAPTAHRAHACPHTQRPVALEGVQWTPLPPGAWPPGCGCVPPASERPAWGQGGPVGRPEMALPAAPPSTGEKPPASQGEAEAGAAPAPTEGGRSRDTGSRRKAAAQPQTHTDGRPRPSCPALVSAALFVRAAPAAQPITQAAGAARTAAGAAAAVNGSRLPPGPGVGGPGQRGAWREQWPVRARGRRGWSCS